MGPKRPYPISLTRRKIGDILNENMEMDHNCFNLAVWMAASNNASMLEKDKYHYMDLQFAVS